MKLPKNTIKNLYISAREDQKVNPINQQLQQTQLRVKILHDIFTCRETRRLLFDINIFCLALGKLPAWTWVRIWKLLNYT